jgi:hypothetical protein
MLLSHELNTREAPVKAVFVFAEGVKLDGGQIVRGRLAG